jgi:lipoprotein-anchoring transpeptidase ErfK/SrfK
MTYHSGALAMSLSRRNALKFLASGGITAAIGASTINTAFAATKYNFTSETASQPKKQTARKKTKPRYRGKRTVKDTTGAAPGTIVISTAKRKLYLVLPGGKAIEYGVGVGREGFAWKGSARIARKAEWPAWHPPAEMIKREKKLYGRTLPARMEGGVSNPLGARALYLFQGKKDTLYRIHGTNAPATIGRAMSSGCIRMLNEEVTDLYQRVPINTKVVVI